MSRSKTVTNDEAFHQRLAWYAEIVYGEDSLIISRWLRCLPPLECVCVCECVRAAGLLSLFYPKFVSRGKTSLAGDVPAGLAGECLCHPRAVHASELITVRDSETCSGKAFRMDLQIKETHKRNVAH